MGKSLYRWIVFSILLSSVLLGCSTEGPDPTISSDEEITLEQVIDDVDRYPDQLVATPIGGGFGESISVKLSYEQDGYTVYYTIDGSIPNSESQQYIEQIRVEETTLLIAIAINNDDPDDVSPLLHELYLSESLVWLDASDLSNTVLGDNNQIIGVFDKSPNEYYAKGVGSLPLLVDGINQKPVFRFDRNGGFWLDYSLGAFDKVTMYVVHQRLEDSIHDSLYARIVSSVADSDKQVWVAPNFQLMSPTAPNSNNYTPYSPLISVHEFNDIAVGPLGVALDAKLYYDYKVVSSGAFSGDIAEVIILGRPINLEEDRIIRQYLQQKWGFTDLKYTPATPTIAEVETAAPVPECAELTGIPALIADLSANDTEVVWAAREQLEQIGLPAVDYLDELLKDTTKAWPSRWSAIRVLGRIAAQDPVAIVPLLTWALADSVSNIRSSAASALGRLGEDAVSAVPALVALALHESDSEVRSQAIDALGQIGTVTGEVLGAIGLAIGEREFTVAMAGQRALRNLGHDREKVAVVLVELLHDDVVEAERIYEAFRRIGSVSIEPLATLLDLGTSEERSVIARVLGQIMPASTPLLLDLTADESLGVRRQAIISLSRARPDKAVSQALIEIVADDNENLLLRQLSARIVLQMKQEGLVPDRFNEEQQELVELHGTTSLQFFVAKDGDDSWSGALAEPNAEGSDGPFKTIAAATRVLQPGDTCVLREGIYREVLQPDRSGEPERPIVFTNYEGETVIFSGAVPITGWENYRDQIYRAPMPWDMGDQNQVFVNGKMIDEARWPSNEGTVMQPTTATVDSGQGGRIVDLNLPNDDQFWQDSYIWCGGGDAWTYWSQDIIDYDAISRTLMIDQNQLRSRFPWEREWFFPRAGNRYILMGGKGLLDSEGEWWYDRREQMLYLWAPGGVNPENLIIEARKHSNMVDLSGLSHIQVAGIDIFASGIVTDKDSSDILLHGMSGKYIGHSYRRDITNTASIRLAGSNIEVNSCEFAYSSGGVLQVSGSDNRIINSYIRNGSYAAGFSGLVRVTGQRHLISHNTLRHSGRDVLAVNGLSESIIQYNIISDAGWLAHDLGMIYGHTTDFGNTVIRYNWVHDNRTRRFGLGIYFDSLSRNAVVHNNVIWNVEMDPVRINNPSHYILVFNNTAFNTGIMRTFDWLNRFDLYGSMMVNNIFNTRPVLPESITLANNWVSANPSLTDRSAYDFRLPANSPAVGGGRYIAGIHDRNYEGGPVDIGAYPSGEAIWIPGHNFEASPKPIFELPVIEFMNLVTNACFDDGTLNGWRLTGEGNARIVTGNAWGRPDHPTGTGDHEVRFGSGISGIEQVISDLEPNTKYRFSAWVRVSDETEVVQIRVSDGNRTMAVADSSSSAWNHLSAEFETGPQQDSVVIAIAKTSDGQGSAFAANTGVQKLFAQ